MNLTYLTYKEIDRKKWDACLGKSYNRLIYAESAYLDHMCANWDAIILNDYEAVMPLAWKRKWGIRYLYQPPFIQQGGVFSTSVLPPAIIHSFLDLAFEKFKFAEFTMNYGNNLIAGKTVKIKPRNNFILQLGQGYEQLQHGYNSYIRQRLNRLAKFSMQYRDSDDITAAIKLYRKLYGKRMPTVSGKDYLQFELLCRELNAGKRVVIRQAFDREGKELLAVVLLLSDGKRLYNIISCVLPKGRKLLANYFLYDNLVREFAGKDIILDFEGSDLPGVSYFYDKFSDSNQQYHFVKYNNLPGPVKLFKR